MKLNELMNDAVAPTTVNVQDLTRSARTQGTSQRRWRQLVAAATSLGGVAAVCLAVALVLPTGPATPPQDQAADFAADPSVPGTTTLDGRSTVAVLRALVAEVARGEFSGYAGQSGYVDFPDTYGELEVTPPNEGLGVVGVNVQGPDILPMMSGRCETSMLDCTSRMLPNGDRLLLRTNPPIDTVDGEGTRRVAEIQSKRRGLRIVVSATNGYDLPSNEWDVTRPDPVLTDAQLTAIATDPTWAFEIPADYATLGDELAPYTDLDANQELEPSAEPSAEPKQVN